METNKSTLQSKNNEAKEENLTKENIKNKIIERNSTGYTWDSILNSFFYEYNEKLKYGDVFIEWVLKTFNTKDPEEIFYALHASNNENLDYWTVYLDNFHYKLEKHIKEIKCLLCSEKVSDNAKLICKSCQGTHFRLTNDDPYFVKTFCLHCKKPSNIFNETQSKEFLQKASDLKIEFSEKNPFDLCVGFHDFVKSPWKRILMFKKHYGEKQIFEWLQLYYGSDDPQYIYLTNMKKWGRIYLIVADFKKNMRRFFNANKIITPGCKKCSEGIKEDENIHTSIDNDYDCSECGSSHYDMYDSVTNGGPCFKDTDYLRCYHCGNKWCNTC